MTIISSQHYIDWDIVESKMLNIADVDEVVIPCSYVGIIDGVEYAMQTTGITLSRLPANSERLSALRFRTIPRGSSVRLLWMPATMTAIGTTSRPAPPRTISLT